MKKIAFILLMIFVYSSIYAEDVKIGLALSGGGARGLAHIGLLKVIDEIGLEVDYISGTSFGALIGGMYSLGYTGQEIEAIFLKFDFRSQISDSISRRDLFIEEKRWLDYGVVNFNIDEDLSLNIPMSILSGNNMLQKLAKYLNRGIYYQTFDDFPIPFRCNATNLTTGESVTFKQGNLIDVVRASMAFPTLLEPFEVNGDLFVDGGVKDNLPVQALTDMGSNYIIANKVNTPLKGKDECEDFIAVLNQTININMNVWVDEAVRKSDLVILPELNSYNNASFDEMQDIIRLGEEAARENITELLRLKSLQDKSKTRKHSFKLPEQFFVNTITTSGNTTIHSSKIKLYSGLKDGNYYSYNDILEASKKCYNTKFFHWVYPKLSYDNSNYNLEFVVKEKANSLLSVDVIYDTSDDLIARATTTMNNVLQKNSKLLASIQLGGINSLTFDYVKNFGDLYGAYYHVFPYLEEIKMYNYNFEGNKSSRIKKLEYGLNLGVGFFLKDILVGEGYLFGYRSRLYQDVAELDLPQRKFKAFGVGVKAYHESIDDLNFPSKGNRVMISYRKALDSSLSDESFEKVYFDLFKAVPLNSNLSLQVGMEAGALRNAYLATIFSPFQVGGIDSFTGMDRHSLNYEAYQNNRIGLLYNYKKRYFINMSLQYLYKGDLKEAGQSIISDNVLDLTLGYKSPIGPLRITVAHDFVEKFNYFISFGFTKDIFKFSKN